MHAVTASLSTPACALRARRDEDLAGQTEVRLLITASTPASVAAIARRIHAASARATLPFVRTRAGDLPTDPGMLRDTCARLLDVAAGGSMLIDNVEEMPESVQFMVVEVLADLEYERLPSAAIRLISGTSVSLLDRVAAGTFSERLFYRLNAVHVTADDVIRHVTPA
jgi:two-component system, NtrC family, C4-dicarboxylate transport response regulator DctD